MTNYDRFNYYMQDFSSPQIFIDWGFYSLIGACLQRRVYLGSETKTLHGNMFNVLVGPPAAGKGMVIGEIAAILKHAKMKKNPRLEENRAKLAEELGDEVMKMASTAQATERMHNMLIPVAPNATTYESLCRTLSSSGRAIMVPTGEVDINTGKAKMRAKTMCAILFTLEELGSLIRKHHEDIHTFLQETYDCKEDYEYRTKNQGADYIRRPCVSLFAGTTPEFLRRIFSLQILNEGFSSRTVFAVAMQPRKRVYDTPVFCKEQLDERERLIDHIVQVCKLQGLVTWTKEAHEFNRHWYEVDYAKSLPNPHPKLAPYYGRINIHHAKLAMAMHFGESLEMQIDLPTAERALKVLQLTEANMHLAINMESTNPLAKVTEDILAYIKTKGEATQRELKVVFYEALPDPEKDVATITTYLIEAGKIEKSDDKPNVYIVKKRKE